MGKDQSPRSYRTREELAHAVRALCEHFGSKAVVIIGSQGILGHWPNAPRAMRQSLEFDAYPENSEEWERRHPGREASEEVEAHFGYESDFHRAFGFYVDGVDASTAKLPPDWRSRQKIVPVATGERELFAIVPGIIDLVISKLCRLDPKDQDWIEACHAAEPLDIAEVGRLLAMVDVEPEVRHHAEAFLDGLGKRQEGA